MVGLAARFLGAMLGSAIGDAVGELAFRYRDEQALVAAINQVETLTYTDDTAMALALSESLAAVGDVDSQHLGDTFRRHFEREPWRGYGPGPPHIFAHVARTGLAYEEAAKTLYGGHGSLGNGAAMRIVPLGLYFFDSAQLYRKAEQSARVTHTHAVGIDGAAVQARAIASALAHTAGAALSPRSFVHNLIDFAQTAVVSEKLERVLSLVERRVAPAVAATQLGLSVAVDESMPFALYCFLRYPDSYRACLLSAILNGGDRDTMGAMAGAISGAYLGADAIPLEWRRKLENHQYIQALARKLFAQRSDR